MMRPAHAAAGGAQSTLEQDRRRRSVFILVAGLALFWGLDAVVFGSGLYTNWVAPQSGLGSLMTVLRAAEAAPGINGGVLVFGSSRMSEGFSAKLANEEALRLGASRQFINSAVPGTSARVWYYMLRDIRDRGLRPAAVVYAADSLHDGSGNGTADIVGNIAFLPPFLGLRDILTFPLSFASAAARQQALEAVLFKGWLLQGDIEDFLARPFKRIASVHQWRDYGAAAIDAYGGHPESLAGLSLEPAPDEDKLPQRLRDYVALLRAGTGETTGPEFADFSRSWYGAAADLCREMGAKMIVFRVPRGPLSRFAPPQGEARGAIADLAAAGKLTIIAPDMFDEFERPELFFDVLHMNSAGREAFSPKLARETLRVLAP